MKVTSHDVWAEQASDMVHKPWFVVLLLGIVTLALHRAIIQFMPWVNRIGLHEEDDGHPGTRTRGDGRDHTDRSTDPVCSSRWLEADPPEDLTDI